MSKFFGKSKIISSVFDLKEGITAPSSLDDYDTTKLKQTVTNKLDPEPIIFISDPTYGNFIWTNGELFGHSTKIQAEAPIEVKYDGYDNLKISHATKNRQLSNLSSSSNGNFQAITAVDVDSQGHVDNITTTNYSVNPATSTQNGLMSSADKTYIESIKPVLTVESDKLSINKDTKITGDTELVGTFRQGSGTVATGQYSHAEGYYTIANNKGEHSEGIFNVSNTGQGTDKQTIHSVGIGTSNSDRKNAVEIMQNGDYYMLGVGGYQGTNTKTQDATVKTVREVINGKQDILKAGTNISIENGEVSATGYKFNTELQSFAEFPDMLKSRYIDKTSYMPPASITFTGAAGSTTYNVGGESAALLNESVGMMAFKIGDGPIALLTSYDLGSNTATFDKSLDENNNLSDTPFSKVYMYIKITFSGDANATTYSFTDMTGSAGDVIVEGGKIKIGNYPIATIVSVNVENSTITLDKTLDPDNAVSNAMFDYIILPNNTASGYVSHAEGYSANASGDYSHAEGGACTAYGIASHAEGSNNNASGDYSHAEGYSNTAEAMSHAEGSDNIASGSASHAEGKYNTASGGYSHAEGYSTTASGGYSHAEGLHNTASSEGSHAEGYSNIASGLYSHTEGYGFDGNTGVNNINSSDLVNTCTIERITDNKVLAILHKYNLFFTHIVRGDEIPDGLSVLKLYSDDTFTTEVATIKSTMYNYGLWGRELSYLGYEGDFIEFSSIQNNLTDGTYYYKAYTGAYGDYGSHSEGCMTVAEGIQGSHSEGCLTKAYGETSHAEGHMTTASGSTSHAEGKYTIASGILSHAEGHMTTASGEASHAEGANNTTSGYASHAEGELCTAFGSTSHAEGVNTTASGSASHAEGDNTTASGNCSHAEGAGGTASGSNSHAEGNCTNTLNQAEHSEGKYNISIQDKTIHTVGIGNSENTRKNAHEIHIDGKHYILGIGGYNGTNSQSNGIKTLQEVVNSKQDKLTTEISWSDLKSKRDNGALIPGMQYRITDYVTTTIQANTQSAGHPFDVIVTALDTNKLSEIASAIQSTRDTNGYFSNSNLVAWQLWYCLDNDTNRFSWADSTNGKGVIYRMIDEFNNDCPYDFKNIQFKRYAVTNVTSTKLTSDILNNLKNILVKDSNGGLYFATKNSYGNFVPSNVGGASYEINENDSNWYYTFQGISSADGSTISKMYDLTVETFKLTDECISFLENNNSGADTEDYCRENKIEQFNQEYFLDDIYYKGRQILNNIVFISGLNYCYYNEGNSYWEYNTSLIYGNRFGVNCNSNTFGNGCYNNIFGNECNSSIFGNYFDSNTFGGYCRNNTFGNGCSSNTFGDGCSSNIFGGYCHDNTFESNCYGNTFGNSCYNNIFGNEFNSSTFGNNCSSNTFGNYFDSNTFGDFCRNNTFGNGCSSNTFGNYIQESQFGDNVWGFSITTQQMTTNPTSSYLKNYIRWLIVENGVRYVNAYVTGSTSINSQCQNVRICLGIQGVDSDNRKTFDITSCINSKLNNVYQPENSQTTSV